MSWLDNIIRDFKYRCAKCGKFSIYTTKQTDPTVREDKPCLQCGSPASYESCLPIKLNLRGRVAFDQNGRKGYVITDGRGNVRYTSATKDHYLETGDIKPHYTKAYEEHLIKSGHADQLETVKYADLVEQRKCTLEYAKTLKPDTLKDRSAEKKET